MKNMIKKSPLKAGVLGLIVLMLLFSGVNTTRAALTIFSDDYYASAEMKDIDISILENGIPVDGDKLLTGISDFQYGKRYDEILTVQNKGTIPEYVRVILHKYWADVDEQGNITKLSDYDPNLIEIGLPKNSVWKDVPSASGEQIIFYYPQPLASSDDGNGEVSSPFVESIKVNGKLILVASKAEDVVDEETGKTVTVYTFLYDGKAIVLEAEAQGVQTHNAADAVTSAWGSDAAGILGLAPQNSNVNQNTELKEG